MFDISEKCLKNAKTCDLFTRNGRDFYFLLFYLNICNNPLPNQWNQIIIQKTWWSDFTVGHKNWSRGKFLVWNLIFESLKLRPGKIEEPKFCSRGFSDFPLLLPTNKNLIKTVRQTSPSKKKCVRYLIFYNLFGICLCWSFLKVLFFKLFRQSSK